jgi:hypothetical protein
VLFYCLNTLAIQSLNYKYPKRFYKFNLWVAQQNQKNFEGSFISIIGLRAEESPDRRFVMFGEDSDLFWLIRKRKPNRFKFRYGKSYGSIRA